MRTSAVSNPRVDRSTTAEQTATWAAEVDQIGRRVRVRVRKTVAVKKHVRVCESATLSLTTTSVPSSGGSVTLNYASTNAASCTLSAAPAFWTGSNPASVNCRGSYSFTVSAANASRQWTFQFTAMNHYGQVVSSAGTLVQQAPPGPPVRQHLSNNWSGWAVENGPYTDVRGTFNVPNLFASVGGSDNTEWVGIDGATNSSLIQAGIHEEYNPSVGGVCIWAWWEVLPAPETQISGMVVAPGNQVTVQIFQVSGSVCGLTVVDNSTGQSFGTEVIDTVPGTSAEWIVEAPPLISGVLPFGDYTPAVTFSNLGVNGTLAAYDQIFMVQGGVVVSSPSALDPNGFTVAYGPTAPPPP
jgi:hypothetical protein